MKNELTDIEVFFLNTLLKISIAGVFFILVSDSILYPEDIISIGIDVTILSACIISFGVRNKYPLVAVLIFTSIILSGMFYQCMMVPVNTTTSLSVILVIGFIFSIMLKGRIMWIMHGITFISLHVIFVLQYLNPLLRFSRVINDQITVTITYSILYFILTYAAGILKLRYDKINRDLNEANAVLHEKADEIEAQNEELIQAQNNLSELNASLENMVNERTVKVQAQNEMLIRYGHANAHHLRGPVARLLGLVTIYKLDPEVDHNFLIDKMAEQANEIDEVIRQISADLDDAT